MFPASPIRSRSAQIDDIIQKSVRRARKNWRNWQTEFERGGGTLLTDPKRFDAFCREYSVGRTIRAGSRRDLQRCLAAELEKAISDDTGHGLDKLEQKLRPDFGTRAGKRRLTSVLSKAAAFVRPERFVAWDAYAKRGLNMALMRPASGAFRTYADYLLAFDRVWQGALGGKIKHAARTHAQTAIERRSCFQQRVLDVCLMSTGGRWRA